MKGIISKDMKKLVKALTDQGFEVTTTTRGHISVELNGQRISMFAGTASDSRSFANSLADARRAGFIWPLGQGRRPKAA